MNPIFVSPQDDLQAVFDNAPAGATLFFAPGEYRQKAILRTRGLTLVGAGADKTVLVFDDHAKKRHPVGYEFNTFRTYTLAVCANDVTIQNMAIVNDARFPEVKGQEVALSVLGDNFRMENCRLSSTQDTLFAGPLPDDLIGRYEGFLLDPLRFGGICRQDYKNCLIEGTVDFIFGCGEATFQDCEIRSLVDARNCGYVAAPAHELRQKQGFLFLRCRFTCEDGVTPGSIYLARPWRDYGIARFENCAYGPHIAAAGFDKWNDTNRDQTARFYESPTLPGRAKWVR